MPNILEVQNLEKSFGGIKAVNNCTFTVEQGSITSLIGPNGAGKTTVFNLITGFSRADKGTVAFQQEVITNNKIHLIASHGISRTFQLIRVFPHMSVLENIMVAEKDQNENFWQGLLMLPRMKQREKEIEDKAINLLKFVGLENKKHELASDLSYGQQKLLELARALANDPKLLLLDEPAAGINPTLLKKIKMLLLDLKMQGLTILLIEHNMNFVMDVSDKIIVLDHGEEIATGKPNIIRKNKRVINAYLGK